ncbi:MAG: hypothetical protein IPN17_28540 [Deltaproteobacteria bacterium]|nr:hypothetical protein [Deltaproteobacteria bacterium]
MTGTQTRPTGGCAGEITMMLRNGCGRAAYCQFRLSDGRGSGGISVASGASAGAGTVASGAAAPRRR